MVVTDQFFRHWDVPARMCGSVVQKVTQAALGWLYTIALAVVPPVYR